VLPLCCLV